MPHEAVSVRIGRVQPPAFQPQRCQKDQQENTDLMEQQELEEMMVIQEHKDLKDQQDLKAQQDQRDQKAQKDHRDLHTLIQHNQLIIHIHLTWEITQIYWKITPE